MLSYYQAGSHHLQMALPNEGTAWYLMQNHKRASAFGGLWRKPKPAECDWGWPNPAVICRQ
jgi:hypothetical protein